MTRVPVPSGLAPSRVAAHRWGARSYWPASLPDGGSNAFSSAVAPSSGGSAHTKGSWVEVTAATTADVYRVAMMHADSQSSGADTSGLSDYLEAHRQMAGPSAVRQVSFDVGAGR